MYGIPYQGGKTAEADRILAVLPTAKNFYDVFAGGCAITHAAAVSHKYEHIFSNDLSPYSLDLFRSCYDKSWIDKKAKQFISRDEFFKLRDTDAFVRIIWSFSTNQNDYVFGKDKDLTTTKQAYDYINGLINEIPDVPLSKIDSSVSSFFDRYDKLRHSKAIVSKLNRLPVLARCYRLRLIADAASILQQKVVQSNKSYDQLLIEPDSIIYCDPPYVNSCKDYRAVGKFDSNKFYEWAAAQSNPIFVSETYMPDNWTPILQFNNKLGFAYSANALGKRKTDILWARKDQI